MATVSLIVAGVTVLLVQIPAQGQEFIPDGVYSGQLGPTDRVSNNRFYDEYRYEGRRGEHLTIRLRSPAFDAALEVLQRSGGRKRNDDNARSPHSLIVDTLRSDGTYVIWVTSSRAGARGAYSLTVLTDRPPPPPPPDRGLISPPGPPPEIAPPPPPPAFAPGDAAQITGVWTWREVVGRGTQHFCDSYGFMFLVGSGPTFSVRFEQKGRCIVAGRTINSAGTFSSANNPMAQAGLPPGTIRFRVERCVYTGVESEVWRMEGTVRCIVGLPDGTRMQVTGTWSAERES
jgi:hypothetical protein